MQKLIWQNANGESVDLTQAPYGITNWEGFANTSLNIQSQQVPFQDGGVFLDALIEQRELSVTLAIQDNNNLEERYRMRRELVHSLNPKLGEGYLIYTNDFISKRIKCIAQIPLFETHNSNDSGTPKASLAWTCPSSYWEDVEEKFVNMRLNAPIQITNNGDVNIGMEIDIFGNGSNPSINNLTTEKHIKYNGNVFPIVINTTTGNKSAKTKQFDFEVINDGSANNFIKFFEKYAKYIIGTSDGIRTSIDNENWKTIQFGVSINGIAINAEGLLVAVGSGGNIFYSLDSINWIKEEKPEGSDNSDFLDVCYMSNIGMFFASKYNTLYKSEDGFNWVLAENFGGQTLYYNDDIHEMWLLKSDIYKYTSDGENWTTNTSSSFRNYSNMIYKNGLYIIVGDDGVISTDKINWTSLNLDHTTDVIYSNSLKKFIISNSNQNSNSVIYVSDDGETWDSVSVNAPKPIYSIDYNEYTKELLMVGYSDLIIKSSDLQTFNFVKVAMSNINQVYECKQLNLIITVGDLGEIYIGNDINNLRKVESPTSSSLRGVVYDVSLQKLFAVSSAREILISSNGEDWEILTTNTNFNGNLTGIAYSRDINKLAVTTSLGYVYNSSNGVDWEFVSVTGGQNITAIYYSEEKKVFLIGVYGDEETEYGNAFISNDLTTWSRSYVPSAPLQSVKCFNYFNNIKKFAVFALNGDVLALSDDGINWEQIDFSFSKMNCINFLESYNSFIAVGNGGKIFYSYDCYNWQQITTNMSSNFLSCISIEQDGGTEIVAGASGTILKSILSGEENVIQNISTNSDMGLNLKVGNNQLIIMCESGSFSGLIKYRQKYIGV